MNLKFRIDTFTPYVFLPMIFILYYGLSYIDFHLLELFDVQKSILPTLFVALISYYIGLFITSKYQLGLLTIPKWFNRIIKYTILCGGLIIGLIAYLFLVYKGQFGIIDESMRRSIDPKLSFLSSFFWFSSYLLLIDFYFNSTVKKKWKITISIGSLLLLFILFLLVGYRTPIAIMILSSLFIFHKGIKRIRFRWVITIIGIITISFSLFALFRILTEDTTLPFNNRDLPQVELSNKKEEKIRQLVREMYRTPEWIRALNHEMVVGHIVLSKIIEHVDSESPMYGNFVIRSFQSILPGKQISPRMYVTEIINDITIKEGRYITRPGRTTIPTLAGQFYLDGGIIGVAIGFLFVGLILGILYNQSLKESGIGFAYIGYAMTTVIFVVSIHTGLLDLIMYLFIIGLIMLSLPKRI